MFVQENIEKLKQQWTDKYVVVAGDRPELRRFEGYTGQVKTVNMSGRALVQFDAWANIGWYDIDPGYLEVVPKPDPSTAGKKAEAKEAAPKAEAKAEAKPAAKPAGGKISVAELLAAARANKPTAAVAAAPAAKPPAAKETAKEKPAAAKPAGGKMSTADVLAAARAKKAAETPAVEAVVEPAAEEAPAPAKPQAAKAASGTTVLPKGQRPTVAQMLAFCHEHDAK